MTKRVKISGAADHFEDIDLVRNFQKNLASLERRDSQNNDSQHSDILPNDVLDNNYKYDTQVNEMRYSVLFLCCVTF
jgi:hypothetical protein